MALKVLGLVIVAIACAILVVLIPNTRIGEIMDKSINYMGVFAIPFILWFWEDKRTKEEKQRREEKEKRAEKEKQDKIAGVKLLIINALEQGLDKQTAIEVARIVKEEEEKRIAEQKRKEEEEKRKAEEERIKNLPEGSFEKSVYSSLKPFSNLFSQDPATLLGGMPTAHLIRDLDNEESLRLSVWQNIREILRNTAPDQIALNCVYSILEEIKFHNQDGVWVEYDDRDNLTKIQAYILYFIEEFKVGTYDIIIYSTIKGKLLEGEKD